MVVFVSNHETLVSATADTHTSLDNAVYLIPVLQRYDVTRVRFAFDD